MHVAVHEVRSWGSFLLVAGLPVSSFWYLLTYLLERINFCRQSAAELADRTQNSRLAGRQNW